MFDETRSPEAVCDVLRRRLRELREREVDTSELIVDNRVSKDVDDYSMETLTVAALKRAQIEAAGLSPGQHVRYVVVDADARAAARVRLKFEDLSVRHRVVRGRRRTPRRERAGSGRVT